MESHIRNIIFDLGNVLIHCDLGLAASAIARASTMSAEEIRATLVDHPLLDEFDEGRHAPHEFVRHMARLVGWTGSSEELESIWNRMLSPDDQMFDYLESLVSRGYNAYILSNINPYHIEHVRSTYPKVLATHGQVFSCECSMIKPNEEIFIHTRDTLGISPQESVFIDDKPANIRAAERVGFIGIVHSSLKDTQEKLETLLLT